MSRYNRGGDREFWLEAWNGGAHCIERLSRPPVSLAHLLVSITGGFQPSKLTRAFGGEEGGMAARYLYAWPAEPGCWPLTDDIEGADPDLQQALMRLIDLPAGGGSKVEPRTLPLDGPARAAFEAFRQG
ncbi:MAG TPA: DUF3987 domain-containing protein [Hyphomicrobiaceae bacterium]|nr:DUF3987 domain-containing protein [Hyphomicrobiaceae bacterium]